MKRLVCSISLLLFFMISEGQKKTDSSSSEKELEFKNLAQTQFSNIVTGNGFSAIGNFLGLSSDSKTLTVGVSKVMEKSVLTLEFGGGANEGVLKIFNRENLNSNILAELKYHYLFKLRYASRDSKNSIERERKKAELLKAFSKDTSDINSRIDYYKLNSSIDVLSKKIANNERLIALMRDSIRNTSDSALKVHFTNEINLKTAEVIIDSRERQLSRIRLDSINKNVDEYFRLLLTERTFKYTQDLADVNKMTEPLLSFDISWFTYGIKLKNDKFNLYYSNYSPGNQIRDTSFLSQRASFAFSRYVKSSSSNVKSFYYSIGLAIDYTTTLSSLEKIVIEENQIIPGPIDRKTKKDINAYVGSYTEGIYDLSCYLDYIQFLGISGQSIGLRFNPSLNYNSLIKKPIMNFSVGIVFPFIDKAKQLSRANLELFYFRQDIADYLKRSTKESFVGVRATFPISL